MNRNMHMNKRYKQVTPLNKMNRVTCIAVYSYAFIPISNRKDERNKTKLSLSWSGVFLFSTITCKNNTQGSSTLGLSIQFLRESQDTPAT